MAWKGKALTPRGGNPRRSSRRGAYEWRDIPRKRFVPRVPARLGSDAPPSAEALEFRSLHLPWPVRDDLWLGFSWSALVRDAPWELGSSMTLGWERAQHNGGATVETHAWFAGFPPADRWFSVAQTNQGANAARKLLRDLEARTHFTSRGSAELLDWLLRVTIVFGEPIDRIQATPGRCCPVTSRSQSSPYRPERPSCSRVFRSKTSSRYASTPTARGAF